LQHSHANLLLFFIELSQEDVFFAAPQESSLSITYSAQNQSYLMTDDQLASLSWYQATIRDPQSVFLFLPWKIFSDIYGVLVGHPPCNLSIQLLLGLASIVTLTSNSARHMAMVEVFYPASTWVHFLLVT
jgi:hypothetical protein